LALSVISKIIEDFEAAHVLQLFAHVEQQSWSFLLDSCSNTHIQSRYDIMVSSPCITYEFANGAHSVKGNWLSQCGDYSTLDETTAFENYAPSFDCPYKNLAKLQHDFDALFDLDSLSAIDVPFIIGAVGAFAYDTNTSSDNIIDDKPAQYKLPDISVGFYHSSIIYDNLTKTLHIFSIYQAHIDTTVKLIKKLKAHVPATASFVLKKAWHSNISKEEYFQQFAKIENYLRAGDCYQINYAQRFSSQYTGSEWAAYLELRKENNAPFSAFCRLPTSTILSLSPERFLSVNDRKVEAKPIKGTRKRDPNSEVDQALAAELLKAEKDRAENLMIVDLLRNDLSKHCQADSVKVPSLFALESYPAVHHMVSTVIGTLKPCSSVYDLLKGAFPGGSITGAPKIRAMQIIQELEPDKRAIYCGSIGYIGSRGDMDSNICIRTLLAEETINTQTKSKEKTLYCWAGGGIVIDSVNEDEYLESLYKVAKILPVLANMNQEDE